MRLGALCLVVVAAALAVSAEPAYACSCAQVDAREALSRFDAAFVGTLVERKAGSNGGVTLVFRVEERFKGALGSVVEVRTASNSAACGIEAPVGARMGLFLERVDGAWHGSLCSEVEPARLREAARPLPAPNGTGPVALLVGGRFGPARTLALDRRGRTLAYGNGPGYTTMFSTCPGSRQVAEVAQTDAGAVLAVRELRTLRLVRQRRVSLPPATVPGALRCTDAAGTDLMVFASNPEFPGRARLLRVTHGSMSTLWRGTALHASLTDDIAYVNAGRRATVLIAVDLRTRRVRKLGRLPAFTGPLAPDASGTRLAGVAYRQPLTSGSPPSRVVVVRPARRPAAVHTAPLASSNVTGEVFWLTGGRLAFFPHGAVDDVRVYDRELRRTARFQGWRARTTAVVGSTAFGLDYSDGRLVQARLPSGHVRVVRRLPSPVAYVLASTAR